MHEGSNSYLWQSTDFVEAVFILNDSSYSEDAGGHRQDEGKCSMDDIALLCRPTCGIRTCVF